MAARTGMTTLITHLRSLTNAGTADVTLAGRTYFSDDHLQTALDATQTYWQRVPLISRPEHIDGDTVHHEYHIPDFIPRWFEENATASGWAVRDSTGAEVDSADYTVNYQAGRITFTADTEGAFYLLYCRTYNPHRAASRVWAQKAAFASANVDWQIDNHEVHDAGYFEHCQQMAALHATLAGPTIARLVRTDMEVD